MTKADEWIRQKTTFRTFREKERERGRWGEKAEMISFEVPRETIHFALQIVGSGSTNSPEAEVQVRHVIFE